jgi:cytochrome P450
MIEFYSADLIQAFYASNINNYVKFEPFVCNFRRMVGNGMAFSEGDDWKKKRRIISSVFHFDFLNSLVPKMNETIDERFQQLD